MPEQPKALKTEILSPVAAETAGWLRPSACTGAPCGPRAGLPRRRPVRKARAARFCPWRRGGGRRLVLGRPPRGRPARAEAGRPAGRRPGFSGRAGAAGAARGQLFVFQAGPHLAGHCEDQRGRGASPKPTQGAVQRLRGLRGERHQLRSERHFHQTWSVDDALLFPSKRQKKAHPHMWALGRKEAGSPTHHDWPPVLAQRSALDPSLRRLGKDLGCASRGHEGCVRCPRTSLRHQSAASTWWREKARPGGPGRWTGAARGSCRPPRPCLAACWAGWWGCGT